MSTEINIVSANISIHVLKVGSKQMTLSFLKQVKIDFLTADRLSEVKVLGYVNYYPEKDSLDYIDLQGSFRASIKNTYNLIFEDNGELKRCYYLKSKYPDNNLPQLYIAI